MGQGQLGVDMLVVSQYAGKEVLFFWQIYVCAFCNQKWTISLCARGVAVSDFRIFPYFERAEVEYYGPMQMHKSLF